MRISDWSSDFCSSDLVADIESFHHLNLRTLGGVADVHRISDPFKLVSRQHHAQRSTVWVGQPGRQVPVGPDSFTLIPGPWAVDSPEKTVEAARMSQSAGATILRGGAFTPPTSPNAFQGLGARRLVYRKSVVSAKSLSAHITIGG